MREILRWRHAAQARSIGLDRASLLLSFDCDTDADGEVVVDLAERLRRRGIDSAYAVPGEQLRRNPGPYQRLRAFGHEILSHGSRPHTEIRDGRYVSTLFYDDLDDAEIEADVREAARAYEEVLGETPRGSRAPHFGTLDAKRRRFTRRCLASEGYTFSSSTLPSEGIRRGPVHRADGLIEIPLSGAFGAPLDVLDSYGFRYAPGRPADPSAYSAAFVGSLRWATERGVPTLLSTYADPSQVIDWQPFWSAIDEVVRLGVQSVTFGDLVDLADRSRDAAPRRGRV